MSQPSSDTLLAAVSGDRLMQTTTDLAKWEKLSGTATELESFAYIRQRMDELGFRTDLILHDAYISLPGQAAIEMEGQRFHCITVSMGVSAPDGIEAEVVDCKGASPADLEGVDLSGRIVLVDGMANPTMAARFRDSGAIGQIHITPDGQLHEACVSPVWGNPTPETLKYLPKTVIVTVSREDGNAIRDKLAEKATLRVKIRAEVKTEWCKTPILTAELFAPDAGPDTPFVMFSGHVDTWYYGVMDNGTANATMIEVARLCAERRNLWKRGLRLCFWSGHSHGRYSSSTWYADEHWHELDRRCVTHVNIDSTGGMNAQVLTGAASAPELSALAADAVMTVSGQTTSGRRGERAGDQSFWGLGIPSIFGAISHQMQPTDGSFLYPLGWWWHTPEDTLDKIDETLLVRDTRVFAHAVWRLLTDPILPLRFDDYAKAFLSELGKISENGLDLTSLRTAAEALAKTAEAFATSGQDETILNARLMRASRSLVSIGYSSGNRFDHDPALSQPPWPTLDPIRKLAGLAQGSAEWHFQRTAAVRAANRIRHALESAIADLRLA